MRWPRSFAPSSSRDAFLASLASHTPNPTSGHDRRQLSSPSWVLGRLEAHWPLTHLKFDPDDDVWQGSFDLPRGPGDKPRSTIRGPRATGGTVGTSTESRRPGTVKFYYDHKTTGSRQPKRGDCHRAWQLSGRAGLPGDWQPDCLRSLLEDPDGDGISQVHGAIPPGNYEVKPRSTKLVGELWRGWSAERLQYPVHGRHRLPGDRVYVRLRVARPHDCSSDCARAAGHRDHRGSLQSELGCAGDWDPACAATHLAFDTTDGVWQGTFSVPAGTWEYKAALNGSWDENYGANAMRGGDNIPLNLAPRRA